MTKSTFSSNRGLVSSVREAVEDFIPKIEFEHMGVRYCTYTCTAHGIQVEQHKLGAKENLPIA